MQKPMVFLYTISKQMETSGKFTAILFIIASKPKILRNRLNE